MKTLHILSGAILLTVIGSFASCRSSRVYENRDRDRNEDRSDNRDYRPSPPPPPSRSYSSFSLIISPTPGFVMNRYPDGRYYHRNSAGMMYWKGYDNRFYLDRTYINRVRYSQGEYNEWKRFNSANIQNKGRRY